MAHPSLGGRALVAATALAAVVLAGCGAPASPAPDGGTGSPTPSAPGTPPATTRSVTADNLLTTDDIPLEDPVSMAVVEAPDGAGRDVAHSYICLPADGFAMLGATSMVTRNFTYQVIDAESYPYPDSPLKDQPTIYTQALQFADEPAAVKAAATYTGWVKACPDTLDQQGYTIDREQGFAPARVRVPGGRATVGMVAYVKPGDTDAENLYWESAGVTRVQDRLMVTITLSWGMDPPGTLDTSDGDFIHPQVTLVEESARRLAR